MYLLFNSRKVVRLRATLLYDLGALRQAEAAPRPTPLVGRHTWPHDPHSQCLLLFPNSALARRQPFPLCAAAATDRPPG